MREIFRKIAFHMAIAGGLSSCFNAPFSSNATVTLPGGSSAAVLTAITDSTGRTSAAFDPNANYAQAISASTGAISGTSAIFPPGSLSLAVNLLVEEGSDLSGSSTLADLALESSNSVTAAGTTVIIRPSSDAELTVPMSLSIPLPAGFGLRGMLENILMLGDPADRIAVLAKVWDPASAELKTILIPPSEIRIESGKATFDTKVFGAFQTVLMENPVTTRVEAKASEPVTNVSGTSVVATTGIVEQSTITITESLPALTVKSSAFSFNADSRLVSASVTLSESVATTSCTLALRDKTKGIILWSASTKESAASAVAQITGILPATITGYIETAATCTAVDGRNAKSTWEYLGQVCATGYFGTSCVACTAGTYWNKDSNSCANAGTGFFATGNGLRQTCTNKPAHSTYSSVAATSSACAWTCDEPWVATGNICTPTGTLTGFPSGTSNATTLSGTVSGNGISAYRAKVGPFSATECANANDYSVSAVASTTLVTNNIAGLPDGEITVCLVGIDDSGAQTPFSSAVHATWIKDTTAPTPPTIVSAAGNTSVTSVIYTNNLVPVIAGTAENSATVSIYNGDTTLGVTTANGSGAWAYSLSSNLAAGTYTITAKSTDAAGNEGSISTQVTLVIDNQTPAAPAITSIDNRTSVASTTYTNNLVPALAGTAESNSAVTIYNGDITLGTTTANGSGSWTFTPSSNLAAGTYTITAKATDAASNQSAASTAVMMIIDTTAPAAPVVTSVAGASVNANTIYAKNLVPGIAGTAEPNTMVTVYNGNTTLGVTTANGSGAWTYTPSGNLPDGTYAVTVKATDAAANQSPASTIVNLVIDSTPPAAPAITIIDNRTSVASTTYTNNLVPALAGTAESNATVSIYNGNTTLGVTTANGSGAWTFTPSSNLAAGTYTITAKATDAASNQSAASTAVMMMIDATAPAAPVVTSVAGAAVNANTIYAKNLVPGIAGTAEANTMVTVYNGNTTLGVTTANGSGAWTYTPSGNLPDGTYAVTVKATDAAANQSPASTVVNLVIDSTPPAAPAITSIDNKTSVSSTIYTNIGTPQITGTAEPNAAVMIFYNSTFFGTTTANAAGAWAFTSTTNLSAGTYSFTAKAKDAAMNEGPFSNAVAMNVDTTAPIATISGFPTGTSNTTVVQITVAGTDVTAYKTKSVSGSASLCASTSGYGSETAVATRIASNISTLNDGSVTVCVIGRDAAGNWQTEANAAYATWTKDTNPPVATLSGAPNGSSSAASLNVTVGGNGVYLYKFKVGTDTTADCTSSSGYGNETPAATPITASLSAIPAGSWAKLCVLGVDAAGNWQTTATATAWQKVCVAGNYPSGGSCAVVGTGYYSTDGLTRQSCRNVPSNAGYSTDNSTTATCPWSCNVNYLLNAAQTGCDYRPNTQAVSCPAGQVIVGAAVRSGGWMDKLGVRCQTFTNGALTGAITDGPTYGGEGGAPYTFDCSAGSYLYRITGGNGTGYYAPESTFLANIKFYCRSLTTDLSTDASIQYGGSAGITPFDYSCAASKPITSIPFDSAGAYVGTILQAYCGSNLK